jgi:hypothetical protein
MATTAREAKLKFFEEKDEFKGTTHIRTSYIWLSGNYKGDLFNELYVDNDIAAIMGMESYDVFRLRYIELEDGSGKIILEIFSSDNLGSEELKEWEDELLFIIDGERVILNRFGKPDYGNSYETINYDIPIELLSKFVNGNEIKFSLRGENHKIEGKFLKEYTQVFKAFELYCFGDRNAAQQIFSSLNSEINERLVATKKAADERERKKKEENRVKNGTTQSSVEVQLDEKTTKTKKYTRYVYLIIILMGIWLYQKSCNSSPNDSLSVASDKSMINDNSDQSSTAVIINNEPGDYIVPAEMSEGVPTYKNDKKTKHSRALPTFTEISIVKIEGSFGYFNSFYGETFNQIPAGWVDMSSLVPEKDYLTYPLGKKFWVKSDLTDVITYKDIFMRKQNKRKVDGMKELNILLIKENMAYFNNGILEDYFKGWIELDRIEEK